MASKVAICSSPPEAKLKCKIGYPPVGVFVTDVSFYVNFLPSGVDPLDVDIVHPKPGFTRRVCNYFKSGSFLHPAALQMEFKRPSQSWLGGHHLKRNHNMSGDKIDSSPYRPHFFLWPQHTFLCTHQSGGKEVVRGVFPPHDSLYPCLE